MKRSLLLWSGLVACAMMVTNIASAAMIDVGLHEVLPGGTLVIDLEVAGGEDVSGVQLFLEIGDGPGGTVEPTIVSVEFTEPLPPPFQAFRVPMGIWRQPLDGGNANASLIGGVTVLANMVQAEGGPGSIDGVTGSILPITAGGVFARLTINVGNNVAPGDYPLKLKDIPSFANNSAFLDLAAERIQTDIENGIIRVVPEPASAVLFVGLLLGGLLPMRRHRAA